MNSRGGEVLRGLVARTGFEPVIFALRGRRPRPLDERATRTPRTEGIPILSIPTTIRQPVLALLCVLACACATLDRAFAPAANPWPIPKESRVRRDGRMLRVYGASLKSRAEAEADAKRSFEAWLWTLDLGDDIPERKKTIEGVLDAAKPVPSPVPEISGFASIIEIDLPVLQKQLGTHYE
jgi:hypothetical protein